MGKLVILAGPSCVGKSPLAKTIERLRPDLFERMRPLVLYNDRAPRPGERDGIDYHFRSRTEIEALGANARYRVLEVRGDMQALDVEGLRDAVGQGHVLFEGNPMVGRLLVEIAEEATIPSLSVFMSPLSRDELEALESAGDLESLVTEVMRRKLQRRTLRQRGELSESDRAEIERRARSAYRELGFAHRFRNILVNHDGEDSENWTAFPIPVGDARRSFHTFCALLEGRTPPGLESWPEGFPG